MKVILKLNQILTKLINQSFLKLMFKPQKTKFQILIIDNFDSLSQWAVNPWRRYSLALTVILTGYFFGSSLGMISAVVELIDPVGAFLSVSFIEILIQLRRTLRTDRRKKLLVLLIDSLRLGLFYGFFTESLKLL